MKKIICLLLTAIVAFGAGVVLTAEYCSRFVDTNVPAEGNYLQMSVASITQKDNFFNIWAEYPQFNGVDAAFNQKIADLMNKQVDDFKTNAAANWEARRATATPDNPVPEFPEQPFDFIATWTPTQINNSYLSFVINVYYFSGGAHGLNEVYAFNYDLNQQKEITINDFLGSSQDALDEVASLASQNVSSDLQSRGVQINTSTQQMIDQGTAATTENYKNFNFSNNALIVYFPQYQVAPGYIGNVTVTLYQNQLTSAGVQSNYLK